jgi:hypothetical protein
MPQYRVAQLDIWSCGRWGAVFGVIAGLIPAVTMTIGFISTLSYSPEYLMLVFATSMPLIVGLLHFFGTVLFAWIYNQLVPHIGAITIQLEFAEHDDEDENKDIIE